MNIENYPKNSEKNDTNKSSIPAKEPKKDINKPIKSKNNKIISYILDFGSNLVFDILIPGIKNAVADVIISGTESLLGNGGRRNRTHNSLHRSYDSYYNNRKNSYEDYGLDDIVYESREDAYAARDALQETLEEYGYLRIADVYDILDLKRRKTRVPYSVLDTYGWYSLSTMSVRSDGRNEYELILPKPINL